GAARGSDDTVALDALEGAGMGGAGLRVVSVFAEPPSATPRTVASAAAPAVTAATSSRRFPVIASARMRSDVLRLSRYRIDQRHGRKGRLPGHRCGAGGAG